MFLELAGLWLDRALGPQADVLVAGVGTGTEMVALGRPRPGWHLTGVDPSAETAASTRRKLPAEGLEGRAEVRVGGVADLEEGRRFDAAVLLLVLQFEKGGEAKRSLLANVAGRLHPGAPLIGLDLQGDAEAPDFARLADAWRAWQFAAGIHPSVVEDTFRNALQDVDIATDEVQRVLLSDAGFAAATPFFRALCFGGWIAYRS